MRLGCEITRVGVIEMIDATPTEQSPVVDDTATSERVPVGASS